MRCALRIQYFSLSTWPMFCIADLMHGVILASLLPGLSRVVGRSMTEHHLTTATGVTAVMLL